MSADTCRGCTGTCCTGVGSDPCTCEPRETRVERETRQAAEPPTRLLLIACTVQVEDSLAAAIAAADPDYLGELVGQLRVLSSTPMPR